MSRSQRPSAVVAPGEPPPAPSALLALGAEDRMLEGLPAAHAATSSRWNGMPATSVTSDATLRPLANHGTSLDVGVQCEGDGRLRQAGEALELEPGQREPGHVGVVDLPVVRRRALDV